MNTYKHSLSRIRLIAGNTLMEALRQKVFHSLLLIALGLVCSATFFQQFDFGADELKFVTDFGFGALFLFGSILSIAASTQLFFSEIENRTALTLLAKPVHPFEFLAGKFLGTYVLIGLFTLLLLLPLAGMLYWRETSLMAQFGEAFVEGRLIRYSDVWVFGLLQWIKFGILSAMTLCIASFSNSQLYTMLMAFFMLMICQLQYIARDAYASIEPGLGRWTVQVIGLIFPNFQLFNLGDQLVLPHADPLSATTVIQIVAYGLVYTVAFILLAQVHFGRREI